MLVKKEKEKNGSALIAFAMIFTAGLVLGGISFFHISENIITEARNAFGIGDSVTDFSLLCKNNFMAEFCWIFIVWMLGIVNLTAPLVPVVTGVRGFFIGFSVVFVLTGNEKVTGLILRYILPQCALGLPVMTLFSILCLRFSLERRQNGTIEARYFVLGAVFVLTTLLVSAIETIITLLFINM